MTVSDHIQNKAAYRLATVQCEAGRRDETGLRWFWQIVVMSAAIALIFSRQPDALLHPQFFAEDGKFWFADAYNDGWATSVLRPLNGYFQTLPRLAAALSLLLPLALAPWVMNLSGLLIQVLPVPVLLSSRCAVWGTLRLRAMLAFTYLVIPNCAETHVVVNAGQWHIALLACLLLLSSPPSNPAWKIFDISVFFLCGLTGPFGILLIPVAVMRLWLGRDSLPLWPLLILGSTSAIQGSALMATKRQHWPLGASIAGLVKILASQVFLGTILGSNWILASHVMPLLIFVAIGGLGLMIYCFLNATYQWKLFLLFSLAVFAASLCNPFTPEVRPGSSSWELLAMTPDSRYWFFPILAFAWSMIWYLSRPHGTVSHKAGLILTLLIGAGLVQDWRIPPRTDVHFARYLDKFQSSAPGTVLVIPENPDGWSMRLVKR
jgi:hypothetical protein